MAETYYEVTHIGTCTLYRGDALDLLPGLERIDAIVTDPPYGWEFMGASWDGANGFRRSLNGADVGRENVFGRTSRTSPEYRSGHLYQQWCQTWAEACLALLKPGGHLVTFGGTRTVHRLAGALEDAGFEIRDQLLWLYGSGWPKNHDVSKAIDKEAGMKRPVVEYASRSVSRPFVADQSQGKAYRLAGDASITAPATPAAQQWDGWGTALKPAYEPILLARKPLAGTVAQNVLRHGTGALHIEACRVAPTGESRQRMDEPSQERRYTDNGGTNFAALPGVRGGAPQGRWPANVLHDGSDEVLACFPQAKGQQGAVTGVEPSSTTNHVYGQFNGRPATTPRGDTTTSAARFFYTAKASPAERSEGVRQGSRNTHPTVKPLTLMQWLVQLIAPPGACIVDPFMGSGTTGVACAKLGYRFIGIEREREYFEQACQRITAASAQLSLFGGA